MIFQTKRFSASWDTWMYYHDGLYYLYYLITEKCGGEGFGVASSPDGVHWDDHGAAILASDKMVNYLGTGSVWKSAHSDYAGKFFCNYSEWRKVGDEVRQNILFAVSDDLIHWEKFGDEHMFSPDTAFYKEFTREMARWDCIYAIPKSGGGYYGIWTASPKAFIGIGLGESDDGLSWRALPSPEITLGALAASGGDELESGAICFHEGLYYMMLGNIHLPEGVMTYTASDPKGPWMPMEKNNVMFSNRSFLHVYFPRLFDSPDGLLCNFHSLERANNEHGRPITWLTPIKQAVFDTEGTMRLKYRKNNDIAKGSPTDSVSANCIVEGVLAGDAMTLVLENSKNVRVVFGDGGVVRYYRGQDIIEEYQRDIALSPRTHIRIMIRCGMTEIYANDWYIGNYTAESDLAGIEGLAEMRVWNWAE